MQKRKWQEEVEVKPTAFKLYEGVSSKVRNNRLEVKFDSKNQI